MISQRSRLSMRASAIAAGVILLATSLTLPATAAEPPGAMHKQHHGGEGGGGMAGRRGMMPDPFSMAVEKLDLTPEQKTSVQSLLDGARLQNPSPMGGDGSRLAVLGNPGDPGYAAAVQQAKTDIANRIQARSDLDVQIYALLTPEQKTKLPQVLADMQAKWQQRRADWKKPQ
jgi:Spy/CpxP family protein refolding chaperone